MTVSEGIRILPDETIINYKNALKGGEVHVGEPRPFEQDVICFIWDFDKTLIPAYMQDPLFRKYGVDATQFWSEVNSLPGFYQNVVPRVNQDTAYLNHILTYIQHGIFKNLNNRVLTDLGGEIEFYAGVPDFFEQVKALIQEDATYKPYGITVEHYIVSTGLGAMIRGSAVNAYVDGIWGCEFIECPLAPRGKPEPIPDNEHDSVLSQIAYAIDNTSKTRALFEINKGTNKHPEINVNAAMDRDSRRVPFSNIIYIADGPSDVPSFSLVKQNGGRTYAVYPAGHLQAFNQVEMLRRDKRVDMYGEADFRVNTHTYLWLTETARDIANNIVSRKKAVIRASTSKAPTHIV